MWLGYVFQKIGILSVFYNYGHWTSRHKNFCKNFCKLFVYTFYKTEEILMSGYRDMCVRVVQNNTRKSPILWDPFIKIEGPTISQQNKVGLFTNTDCKIELFISFEDNMFIHGEQMLNTKIQINLCLKNKIFTNLINLLIKNSSELLDI